MARGIKGRVKKLYVHNRCTFNILYFTMLLQCFKLFYNAILQYFYNDLTITLDNISTNVFELLILCIHC